MQLTFSVLNLEVPKGWVDRSTATFLMPPKAADPRLMKVKTEGSPGNVSVSWVAATSMSADEYLTTQEPALKGMGEGYTVVERTRLDDMGVLQSAFQQGGQALTQIVCSRRVGALQVMVVGTGLAPFAADIREAALNCARSLQPAA